MKIYQADAFTDHVFGGNPAAVCPLETWISDEKMQKTAMENNLSETAFFVPEGLGFYIRWFTPETEIDLCGHATLASAHIIFNHLGYERDTLVFRYGGGTLKVQKQGDTLLMDFPAIRSKEIPVSDDVVKALGTKPKKLYKHRDLMAVFDSEAEVSALRPDFFETAKLDCLGIIATAKGDNTDFVSRFFAPKAGINEDPVTGSAHCMLIPYWSEKLGKKRLHARQISKRIGDLMCEYNGERVGIGGKAVTYLIGEINI